MRVMEFLGKHGDGLEVRLSLIQALTAHLKRSHLAEGSVWAHEVVRLVYDISAGLPVGLIESQWSVARNLAPKTYVRAVEASLEEV